MNLTPYQHHLGIRVFIMVKGKGPGCEILGRFIGSLWDDCVDYDRMPEGCYILTV